VQGALVVEPQPGVPRPRPELRRGDIITSLNGVSIKDDRELIKNIGDLAPGTEVKTGRAPQRERRLQLR